MARRGGTQGWHVGVACRGGTQGWHIGVAHRGGTQGWHIGVAYRHTRQRAVGYLPESCSAHEELPPVEALLGRTSLEGTPAGGLHWSECSGPGAGM